MVFPLVISSVVSSYVSKKTLRKAVLEYLEIRQKQTFWMFVLCNALIY